jgi:hypothetical protein
VHVSRRHERPKGEVWPTRLTDPLPSISIPILSEDNEIIVDLGKVLRMSYQDAAYDRSIDYKAEPIPLLRPEAAAWADRLLRDAGLR